MEQLLQKDKVPFKSGDIIKEIFTLQRQLGSGSYGVIFSATYTSGQNQKHVAIKLEKNLPQFTLQANEVQIMKTMENNNHFAKFYQCGTHEGYKYVVMELLGPSLRQLANRQYPFKFSLSQLLKFGIQAIEALRDLHNAGFVHRDIKPENFLIGNSQKTAGKIFLIDFGLSKRIVNQIKNVEKSQQHTSIRGTVRYASPNAHKHLELGKSDDLVSLLYILVELYDEKLPWATITDLDIIFSLKTEHLGGKLCQKMPNELQYFEDHIFSLNYGDEPDYQFLISLLETVAERESIDLQAPFDWESEIAERRAVVIQNHQKMMDLKKNKREKY
ncbi:MAG: putative protein serine/threonine kinase [Streblomastix strix]|uniref:non-specific serine/threonine protein kinase n=1 Tax=Streblomastix strix TaxID=222440 RepID=A0A5J4VKH7_9EUKA|nr:MAG: putative protein serine/threonine kinase [Streblomastix strix]